MAKPKYYLKPFWMAVKQSGLKPDTPVVYGILKENWKKLREINSCPRKFFADSYELDWLSGILRVRTEYLTKRLSMETKNIKRGK